MAHKTAGGKIIDMNQFRLQNETEIAVGNARVNARGDRLGAGGQIIQTRDEIIKEFYQAQTGQKNTGLRNNPVQSSDEMFLAAADQVIADAVPPVMPEFDPPEPAYVPDASTRTEAIAQSQALAERLKAQRQKEADEKNQG
jgi:hypothetical protein